MATILLRNNLEGDGPVTPPVHEEDDLGYQYCMYLPGNIDVAFADSYVELLGVLIPGYAQMPEEEQIYQRIRLAQSAATRVQSEVLMDHDSSEVTKEEWDALVSPRAITQPRADWWSCPIPLVVVETGYEPFTDIPRPASALSDGNAVSPNLWWIRPIEEEDFLISLHEVGYIAVMTNTEL